MGMASQMSRRGHNEGTIVKRADGRWAAVVNLGYVEGKRKRKYVYGATRTAVKDELTRLLRDKQLGLPIDTQRLSVAGYMRSWLDGVVRTNCRLSTYHSYVGLVDRHIIPPLGKSLLTKLTPPQLRQWMTALQQKGLSPRTVQYCHAVLRKALNNAVKDGLIPRNVVVLVDPPRRAAREVEPLTPDEARGFLTLVQGDRLEALYTVAVSLGLRQGEALGLRWQDIDLEARTLRVRYALQRVRRSGTSTTQGSGGPEPESGASKPPRVHLVEPKTRRSRRIVELPAVTLAALAAHRLRQAEERTLCGSAWNTPIVHCEGKDIEVDDFVFTTSVGTPLESRNVTKRFQRLLKAAKISRHRFHDLRHTAATLLAVQGVHPRAIQGLLGWDQASMLDRYTHVVDEMRKDAATKMNAILMPIESPAKSTIGTELHRGGIN